MGSRGDSSVFAGKEEVTEKGVGAQEKRKERDQGSQALMKKSELVKEGGRLVLSYLLDSGMLTMQQKYCQRRKQICMLTVRGTTAGHELATVMDYQEQLTKDKEKLQRVGSSSPARSHLLWQLCCLAEERHACGVNPEVRVFCACSAQQWNTGFPL